MAQSPNVTATTVTYGTATVANGKAPVTTVCTPASGILFSVGQTTVTCTATDSLQRTDSCSFSVTVVPPPQLTATSFLAFGDSITRGEDGRNALTALSQLANSYPRVFFPNDQTYPGVLQLDLASRYLTQTPTVFNAGLPGEVASDPTALVRFTTLVSGGGYTAVLIMEGSNDLNDRDDRIIPAAIDALRQMLHAAKGRGIRPYLATIPPMDPAGSRGLPSTLVPGYNFNVRALAATEGVTLVDVYEGFGAVPTALLGFDGLHPSAAGYAKIADLFFTTIKQTLEKPQLSSSATAGGTRLSAAPAAGSRDVRRPAPRGR